MKTLGESQRQALASLLADDDPRVRALLEEQFAAMGEAGYEFLEATVVAGAPAARRGAQRVLDAVREQAARRGFEAFCSGCADDCDLETGCWQLARTRYWQLDETRYRSRLDEMARELKERITGRETPRSAVEVCNHYLFRLLGFRGNAQDYYDPDNSYLNRVLDRRLGIPITLSVVYLLIGGRLGLPLAGVGLPGHFLIKWRSPDTEFFIDPFNHGQLLDAAGCRAISERLAGGFSPAALEAATARSILARTCRNLRTIYTEDEAERAEWLGRCVAWLSPAA